MSLSWEGSECASEAAVGIMHESLIGASGFVLGVVRFQWCVSPVSMSRVSA